jgi:hypothetical protein
MVIVHIDIKISLYQVNAACEAAPKNASSELEHNRRGVVSGVIESRNPFLSLEGSFVAFR